MKELYQQFITTYENYQGTGKLLVLFLVAVLVIFLIEKNGKKDRRKWNPAVFLLSIWTGIAYAASMIAGSMFSIQTDTDETKKKKRLSLMGVLSLVLCILFLSLSGTRVFSNTYFEKADNSMHIRQEYVQVMDALLEETESPKVIAPPGFAPYLKMYSSRFKTLYDYPRNGDTSQLSEDARAVYEQLSGAHPDTKLIADTARENGCQYVLMEEGKFYPDFPITEFGFEYLKTVGGWNIYKEKEGNGI